MPGRHAIDNETVIPMCMHSDYIYIVSYSSHGHSVLINGAATVSIESKGISNPHGDAVLKPGGFLQCKLLGARARRAGAAEEENFFKRRESVSVTDGGRVVCTHPYTLGHGVVYLFHGTVRGYETAAVRRVRRWRRPRS